MENSLSCFLSLTYQDFKQVERKEQVWTPGGLRETWPSLRHGDLYDLGHITMSTSLFPSLLQKTWLTALAIEGRENVCNAWNRASMYVSAYYSVGLLLLLLLLSRFSRVQLCVTP